VVVDRKVVGVVTEYNLILALTTEGSGVDLGKIMKKTVR
jgi:CBS domain-containing protein